MKKTPIPAATALVLVTTACGPNPAVGVWDGTEVTVDGESLELPASVDYGFVVLGVAAALVIDKDSGGRFQLTYTYDYEDGEFYSYRVDEGIRGTKLGRGKWRVEVPAFFGLDLSCGAAGDSMSCSGDNNDGEDWGMKWSRTPGT